MKRIHIHVGVKELDPPVEFYTVLFGTGPNVLKADYAKWSLDNPAVNFALSSCCGDAGIHHLGIQVERDDELDEVLKHMHATGHGAEKLENVSCCYSRQDKAWVEDPLGVRWEAFRTHGEETGTSCCS